MSGSQGLGGKRTRKCQLMAISLGDDADVQDLDSDGCATV